MRKSFARVLVTILMVPGSMPVFAQGQGAVSGVAQSADKAPLPNYRVHVRNANTGGLSGSTMSNSTTSSDTATTGRTTRRARADRN